MTDRHFDPPLTDDPERPTGDGFRVRAVVEEHEDRPNECTLFPVDPPSRIALMATWITAREGSYLDLRSMR